MSAPPSARRRTFTFPSDFAVAGRIVRVAQVREQLEFLYDVDPKECLAHLAEIGRRVDVFTFWQRLPAVTPDHDYYYEWDNVAAVPVSTYDHWYRAQIHQNTRNKIKKAEKSGIDVEPFELNESSAAQIASIFNEAQIRQGRHFTHFGVTPAQVLSEWSADADIASFIGAFYKGELVGFIKLLHAGSYYRTSGTLSMLAHRDKAPMNALIAYSVRICAESNVPYLVYGKFVYGAKGEDSLAQFKRYNGFQKYDLPRYFIPLTIRGDLAIRWGLHRPLKDIVPTPLVRALVAFRSAAYRQRERLSALGGQQAH